MRIATDSSFTSFYPPERLPLSLPLQEPLYVEVRVRDPPDPGVTLRIRDCFAYPASRHSLWVLLYNGCPNTLDSEFPSSVLEGPGAAGGDGAVQYRRFDIKTFTFIDPETGEPSQEEVYFYCWVEVCAADSERCQSQCVHNTTAGQSDSERLRRQLGSDPEARLVSVGPVRLGNGTAHRTPPPDSLRTGAVLEMLSVYSISAIGSASLFLLLSALAMGLLRRRAIRRSGVARESGAVATDTASETVATS
ncbi:ZP1 protein, partial [Amia calva]|nr:ZP1 protein [Amia calva]